MELREGYKLTGVGMIPDIWSVKRLREFATIATGNTPPTADAANYGDEFLFVSPVDLGESKHIIQTDKRLSKKGFSIARRFPKDSVLFVCIGSTIGKCGVASVELTSNQQINAIFPAPTFSSEFLYYAACAAAPRVKSLAGEQAVPLVNKSQFSETEVAMPPLPEQRAIATALSDVDALLAKIDQLIAKKRDLKQATMQQLLTGQTRLPGFSPANPQFRESPVGVIPSDWKVSKLVDLVDPSRSIRYGIVQPGHYDPQGRFMIRGQDYSESKGWASPSDVFRVSPQIEDRYRNARVITGDLIMTIVGYCGHVEMVPEWLDGANLTQTTVRIAILPNLASSTYCKFVLASPIGRNQVSAFIKGAAQPGLNCGDIDNFLLTVPSIQEQIAIATVLADMDAEIAALEARRGKTRALKQGMMQALLTGRVRLAGRV